MPIDNNKSVKEYNQISKHKSPSNTNKENIVP